MADIRGVLANPKLRVRLLAFARTLFVEEMPLFHLAVSEYERAASSPLCDAVSLAAMARSIYAEYLENDSAREVNVSRKDRARVLEQLRSGVPADFGPLKREAESIMSAVLFVPFREKVLTLQRGMSSGASLLEGEGSGSSAAERDERRQTHKLLITLLLERQNHCVLAGLMAVSAQGEGDEVAPSVIELLLQSEGGEGLLLSFFDFVVKQEVAETRDPNTLFRERSVFVALFADLLARQPCKVWLAKMCKKAVIVARRSESAIKTAAHVLRKLSKHREAMPPVLSRVLFLVSQASAASFPAMRFKVVASFVFLRCIGPVLVEPVPLLCSEQPKAGTLQALRGALRLLMAKSADLAEESASVFEGDELAFLRGAPSMESLMHLIIDREAPSSEEKVAQIIGARQRSGSVSRGQPPMLHAAAEDESGRLARRATASSPASPPRSRSRSGSFTAGDLPPPILLGGGAAAAPGSMRKLTERTSSFSSGLHTIRALFSPNSTPRFNDSDDTPPPHAELVRGGSHVSGSPAVSPRGHAAGGQAKRSPDAVEEQVVALRQVVINALLVNWSKVRQLVPEAQLGEPAFQWFESVLNGILD